jgi:hypothetical protein
MSRSVKQKLHLPDEPFDLRVVGVTFQAGYPDVVYELLARVPVRVRLVREPENPHDRNAILVKVGRHVLGHVSRSMAKRLALELDRGIRWRAWVTRIDIHPDAPDNPGIWLSLKRAS